MKKIVFAAVVAALAFTANAQSFDKVFISVGGGVNVYSNGAISKGGAVAPAVDLSVGNAFTKDIEARVQWAGISAKGLGGGKSVKGYNTVHADFMWNALNTFGVEADRLYSVVPFVGPGVAFAKGGAKFAVVGGIVNRFRLSNVLDANLELRGVATARRVEGAAIKNKITSRSVASATIGLTYKFGN